MGNAGTERCPAVEECRALVQRILATREFQRAPKLREFLIYVVDRKLEGSPHESTNEVALARKVFRRPASFKPNDDSIVRTEARILRQRLEHYFAAAGRDEPVVLEIPKGGYIPVFRFREEETPQPADAATAPLPQPVPPRLITRRAWLAMGGAVPLAGLAAWRILPGRRTPPPRPPAAPSSAAGAVELDSSDARLVRSFQWARQRALGYAYTGDAVGDWYEGTAGNRYTFCMRDVAHQSTGAAVLGLARSTRNMLRHFAAGISESKDWCSFWQITKNGFPGAFRIDAAHPQQQSRPPGYFDDRHFWYCLPANFDVMRAAWRQFLWTGDRTYFDAVFTSFYDHTATSYVDAWDPSRTGILQARPSVRPDVMASYHQEAPRPLVAADLLAAQYAGYLAYAAIQEQEGAGGSLSRKLAEDYRAKAQSLRVAYNSEWWDEPRHRYYSLILPNHSYSKNYYVDIDTYPLLFGLPEPGIRTSAALDLLEKNRPEFLQVLSYFPEILFQYGRNDSAYQLLLELADPNVPIRGLPEVVFAVVGAVAIGLMGLDPDAPGRSIETLPHLPKGVDWVALSNVPILQNEIAVRHSGDTETAVTNQAGPEFHWRAAFPAPAAGPPKILVDGAALPATVERRPTGQPVAFVTVPVAPGQTRKARLS